MSDVRITSIDIPFIEILQFTFKMAVASLLLTLFMGIPLGLFFGVIS